MLGGEDFSVSVQVLCLISFASRDTYLVQVMMPESAVGTSHLRHCVLLILLLSTAEWVKQTNKETPTSIIEKVDLPFPSPGWD